MISIIKKLQVLVNKLKERQRKVLERKLNRTAEDIDSAQELYLERLSRYEELIRLLEERAVNKLVEDNSKANARKKELGNKLEELDAI